MNKIAIVTDTDCSLPLSMTKPMGIFQVPIMVHFGNEEFKAVFDINDAQTFERIDRENKLAKTSAPTPEQFVRVFKQALDQGYESILCITVSAAISDTYQSAVTACEQFPRTEIRVIDSRTLTLVQGMMVLAATEVINKGGTIDQAIAAAESTRERSDLFVALSTLKYLSMSGRIGYLAAGIATLLDYKPILSVQDGKLEMLERVRTQKSAWERIIELAVEKAAGNSIQRLGLVHVNAPEAAQEVEAQLRQFLLCPDEILIAELNPGLSIHSGSGMVGIILVIE